MVERVTDMTEFVWSIFANSECLGFNAVAILSV